MITSVAMALTDPQVLNAACRFFRVATVVLSLASAAVMLSANEPTGSCCDSAPEGEVSYDDYSSFTYVQRHLLSHRMH